MFDPNLTGEPTEDDMKEIKDHEEKPTPASPSEPGKCLYCCKPKEECDGSPFADLGPHKFKSESMLTPAQPEGPSRTEIIHSVENANDPGSWQDGYKIGYRTGVASQEQRVKELELCQHDHAILCKTVVELQSKLSLATEEIRKWKNVWEAIKRSVPEEKIVEALAKHAEALAVIKPNVCGEEPK